MLPIGCRLAKVTSDGEGLVLSVVEEKMNQREEASTPAPGFPRVCDSYSAKLRATELAGDIASTILQTAWVAIATTSTDTVH